MKYIGGWLLLLGLFLMLLLSRFCTGSGSLSFSSQKLMTQNKDTNDDYVEMPPRDDLSTNICEVNEILNSLVLNSTPSNGAYASPVIRRAHRLYSYDDTCTIVSVYKMFSFLFFARSLPARSMHTHSRTHACTHKYSSLNWRICIS